MAKAQRRDRTHIGVLSIDTSNKIGEAMSLFVFVWDDGGVCVERALVDLEACLVCNPIAVSERRSGRGMISGHIMDIPR